MPRGHIVARKFALSHRKFPLISTLWNLFAGLLGSLASSTPKQALGSPGCHHYSPLLHLRLFPPSCLLRRIFPPGFLWASSSRSHLCVFRRYVLCEHPRETWPCCRIRGISSRSGNIKSLIHSFFQSSECFDSSRVIGKLNI